MKKLPVILSAICILFSLNSIAQTSSIKSASSSIFPKGQRGPASTFTGTVWVAQLVANDSTFNCVMGNVSFEAGARSFWHTHPAGQILLITDGIGYYQEKGKAVQLLHKGDVIQCQPNVEHWHGASESTGMTHISLNPNTEKGIVTWLRPVSEEEYSKAPKSLK
jgi:quercetin dioxygenase-like cupin family protein